LHEIAVLQPILVKFPTRLIRDNHFKNKEFSNRIRDLRSKNQESTDRGLNASQKAIQCIR
jgi:hypothetical protein